MNNRDLSEHISTIRTVMAAMGASILAIMGLGIAAAGSGMVAAAAGAIVLVTTAARFALPRIRPDDSLDDGRMGRFRPGTAMVTSLVAYAGITGVYMTHAEAPQKMPEAITGPFSSVCNGPKSEKFDGQIAIISDCALQQ